MALATSFGRTLYHISMVRRKVTKSSKLAFSWEYISPEPAHKKAKSFHGSFAKPLLRHSTNLCRGDGIIPRCDFEGNELALVRQQLTDMLRTRRSWMASQWAIYVGGTSRWQQKFSILVYKCRYQSDRVYPTAPSRILSRLR